MNEPFQIEALISRDIEREIENAQRDEANGFHEAALHHCGTAKQFCHNLIARLQELIDSREVK